MKINLALKVFPNYKVFKRPKHFRHCLSKKAIDTRFQNCSFLVKWKELEAKEIWIPRSCQTLLLMNYYYSFGQNHVDNNLLYHFRYTWYFSRRHFPSHAIFPSASNPASNNDVPRARACIQKLELTLLVLVVRFKSAHWMFKLFYYLKYKTSIHRAKPLGRRKLIN